MDNQIQNSSGAGVKKVGSGKGFHCCGAIAAILIIILVWLAPSWSKIAITVLAGLIIIGSGSYSCKKKG